MGADLTMADLSVCTMVDTIAGGRLGLVHPSFLDDLESLKAHSVAVHSSPLFLEYKSAYSS